MGRPSHLVLGTLDLKTISPEPGTGGRLPSALEQISNEVQQGSLYPALHRPEQKAWVKAKWADSEIGRKPSSLP